MGNVTREYGLTTYRGGAHSKEDPFEFDKFAFCPILDAIIWLNYLLQNLGIL